MLMDNSNSGRYNEALNQGQEVFEQAPSNFEAPAETGMQSLENPADERANNNAETQRMRGELEGFFEQQSTNADAATEGIGEKEPEALSPELEELNQIAVPKDAKTIPTAFASKAQSIIEKDLKNNDPAAAVDDFNNARWTYMKKAFGRNLGDGLNGNKG